MQTHFLFDVLEGYQPFEQIAEESRRDGAIIAASGLAGAQKAHLACALAARTARTISRRRNMGLSRGAGIVLPCCQRAAPANGVAGPRGYTVRPLPVPTAFTA